MVSMSGRPARRWVTRAQSEVAGAASTSSTESAGPESGEVTHDLAMGSFAARHGMRSGRRSGRTEEQLALGISVGKRATTPGTCFVMGGAERAIHLLHVEAGSTGRKPAGRFHER